MVEVESPDVILPRFQPELIPDLVSLVAVNRFLVVC